MKATISCEELGSRYEALIRLAEVIRSHPEEKDLFETCTEELHQVVSFDGLNQFDPVANRVRWHFLEPYNRKFKELAFGSIEKEATAAWWVYQNQQPVVLRSVDGETRFPRIVERLGRLDS